MTTPKLSTDVSGYGFGCDREATAAMLRALADRIESGGFLLKSVNVANSYEVGGWVDTTFTITGNARDEKREGA